MDNNLAITVITPTFNRSYTLNKAYESLCNQSCPNFLWLIVDDGSTDETEDLIKEWKKEKRINIKYIKKNNGGKASALNVAFDNLTTPYCVCLDSDDYFTDTAILDALEILEEEKDNNKCCGLLALHIMPDGTYFGGKGFDHSIKYITVPEIQLNTEYARFYKTSALEGIRFPEFEGEKFVSPIFIDYLLAEKYSFRVAHKNFCICEYMPDGLTRNKRAVIKKNPKGYTAVKRYSFLYAKNIKSIIKNGIMYDCGCILGNDKDWLKNSPRKLWSAVLYPLGFIVSIQRFKHIG